MTLRSPATTFTPGTSAGGRTSTGGATLPGWSTVTVAALVAVFPAPSRAVNVTLVLPTGSCTAASFVTVGVETRSVARTPFRYVASAASVRLIPAARGAATVTSGALIAGGVVSRTMTVNALSARLPTGSVAAQPTVVRPSAN